MPYLPKPGLVLKKTPLIDEKCDEEVVEMACTSRRTWSGEPRLSLGSLMCLTLAAFFVTLVGIATGFMLYRQYIRAGAVHRYQGFCTIPMRDQLYYEPNGYRVMPLHWSSEPDVQVFSAADRDGNVEDTLQEQLEIGDTIEKISVVENGRPFNFIHDFEANITGIVDPERCFVMDLDPEMVLSPEVFVLSIEGGDEFDVSHVRSSLRAALPALQQLAIMTRELAEKCSDRPTYKLTKEEGVLIRKRDADVPPHDYVQFAGRHVQKIDISNLADVLQHEQQARGE